MLRHRDRKGGRGERQKLGWYEECYQAGGDFEQNYWLFPGDELQAGLRVVGKL